MTVAAKVRVGLGRICRDLAARDANESANDSNAGAEQIEVYAVDGPRAKRPAASEHDSLAASISSFSDPMWQVKDRSVAGLRIAASGGIGQSLALGALVAVRQSDITDWVLGVVRRLNKVSNDEVEAGVSIIAERLVPVVLHAKREAKEDLGIIVNGIDVSTMGARFDGALPAAAVAPRQAACGEDADRADLRIRRGPQRHPDHRPLGVHRRAAPAGRAARRVELGGDPDRREEAEGRLTVGGTLVRGWYNRP